MGSTGQVADQMEELFGTACNGFVIAASHVPMTMSSGSSCPSFAAVGCSKRAMKRRHYVKPGLAKATL